MNYISIPKFAEQIGITRQAIYKRLRKADPEFMKYIKKQGNITKIAEEAKVLFDTVNNNGNCEQDFVNQNNDIVNSCVNSEPNSVNCNDDFVNSEPTFVNQNDNPVNSNGNSEPNNVNAVNHDLQQIIDSLQAEKLEMSKQISSLIEVQNKHLNQIESLYSQLKDKDKLIEQLSTQMLSQTRLPVIVEPPKQTFFQKLKFKLFKK